MSLYRDRVYPYLVSRMGDPKPIRGLRRKVIPLARGTVLEVGSGAGANFRYYDPVRVTKLYAMEPNARMIALAEAQRPANLAVEYLELPGNESRCRMQAWTPWYRHLRLARYPTSFPRS